MNFALAVQRQKQLCSVLQLELSQCYVTKINLIEIFIDSVELLLSKSTRW